MQFLQIIYVEIFRVLFDQIARAKRNRSVNFPCMMLRSLLLLELGY